jgi:hypothetical protein
VAGRDRDVAEIDRILAEVDTGPHVTTMVPEPGARKRILKMGEGPVYAFREVAAQAWMKSKRAGALAARYFVDDKPYLPSPGELRKAGAENAEVREWTGEGSKMATKKAVKKGKGVKGVKGTKKKVEKGQASQVKEFVFGLLKKNPNMDVDEFMKLVKAKFPQWNCLPRYLGRFKRKAVAAGIMKKVQKTPKPKKAKKAKRKKK